MKILALILGIVFTVLGLGFTIYSWYAASASGRIYDGLTYSGPVLLTVGIWRVLSSSMASAPPSIFRMLAVGLGVLAGFGNTAAIKAAFPGDQVVTTSTKH